MADQPAEWPEFPVAMLGGQTSPEAQELWEESFRQARRASWHGPIAALPNVDMIVRHEDACALLSDERYVQHLGALLGELALLNPKLGDDFHAALAETEESSLIHQEGDYHRALRALFGRGFSARRVKALRPYITDLATRLVDAMRPGDDFVECFATRIPPITLCEVIGIPDEDRGIYEEHVANMMLLISRPLAILSMDAEQASAVVAAREAVTEYAMSLLERRRADPQDDLVSDLARAENCPLDDRALAINIGDLLFGGSDNTQRTLGQMVVILTEHPDVWDAVAEDPSFADTVVEECLRYRPAAPGPFRRTTDATQYRDAAWAEGQVLWSSSYSVNRDEDVFEDGSKFEPGRSNVRSHLSFGHGVHHCIGASLARAELQESLRVLTATMTCPVPCGEVVIRNEGSIGPVSVPIEFKRRA
ncbi:MAG: cytochrome P450 [Acidimicrobiia bacterium]